MTAVNPVQRITERHKLGEPIGVTSVCSAHPVVIEAALVHAGARDAPVALIEATSNQVNQDGGYTGMTPEQFRTFAFGIARAVGFDADKLVLGGDHLGPNAWTHLSAADAMAKAEHMVRDYAAAGFGKIHLDCSMRCADDPAVLPERTIAERAARLCAAAEAAAPAKGPVYVIGTEVPVPGGAAEELAEVAVTSPEAALQTVSTHREVFEAVGLRDAFSRVIASVVQPGVEFDHLKVVDYRPERARSLSDAIRRVPGIVYEAHSTDYQTKAALSALVRDHFAVLKVGPGVTFALREALWALDAIERELYAEADRADLRQVTVTEMHRHPKHWQRYYHGEGSALRHQLEYSFSDRIRYYWPDPTIAAAQARLLENLRLRPPPLPLLSQFLPIAYEAVRAGTVRNDPRDLLITHIAHTLDQYHGACHPDA